MSVRRFIGYFIVLSACSTIAFASSLMDQAATPDPQEAVSALLPLPVLSVRTHKTVLKRVQLALAE